MKKAVALIEARRPRSLIEVQVARAFQSEEVYGGGAHVGEIGVQGRLGAGAGGAHETHISRVGRSR